MITCHRCKAQLEEGSLYCEECGALLKTGGSDGEYKKKLTGLNEQLAESNKKNSENSLEIAGLKKVLTEKDKELSNYMGQTLAAKESAETIKGQRNGAIIAGTIALAISIGVGGSSYSGARGERDSYFSLNMFLERENAGLKNQISSFEDQSEKLQAVTDERDNLKSQVNSLTNRNNSLQREAEELRLLALDIRVTAVSIGNIDNSGRVIGDFGARLEAGNIRFLSPRITYNSRTQGQETFYIKIIDPSGTVKRWRNSPDGYSYKWSINVARGIHSDGLGTPESRSVYTPGRYTVEVWHKNICLASVPLTLH